MNKTQTNLTDRYEILNRIYMNKPILSPIVPGAGVYRTKKNRFVSKKMLQEQLQSMKNIKISKTQKIIQFSNDINDIVKSKAYHSLQKQYFSMKQHYQSSKNKFQSQLKSLSKQIQKQQIYTQQLCNKLSIHDKKVDELKQIYYQMRLNNYELRCELEYQRNQRNGVNNVIYLSQQSQRNSVINVDEMTYEEMLQLEDRVGKVNVGLKSVQIKKLIVEKYKEVIKQNNKQYNQEEVICCVCCENIQKQQNVIKLSCSHIHHSNCISQWLKIKRLCPLCKQQVKINNINNIDKR